LFCFVKYITWDYRTVPVELATRSTENQIQQHGGHTNIDETSKRR